MRKVVGACALDCPDGCSWVVDVDDDGRPLAMRGNPDHPYTRGRLCAKVNRYVDFVTSPDRLLTPLRRVGAKGEGRFEPITWDEALTEIAGRMRAAIDVHGGESIWPYDGTGTLGWLQGGPGAGARLFNVLGASAQDMNICSVAGRTGLSYTLGAPTSMDPSDIAHAGLVLVWGANLLTTNVHLWPAVTAAREAGAPLVVVDPIRTRTAAYADLHVQPRPGTDAALVLGLLANLVELGACDETYAQQMTLGWADFRDEVVRCWTPARAAEICHVDEATIRHLARMIADHSPLAIRCSMGMQRHAGGGAALRMLSTLPAVTGDYGTLGGGLAYSTGGVYGLNAAALARPDLAPGPRRRLKMTGLGSELLTRDDPPIDVLMMWAANPVVSNPDQQATRAGLARDDLFTVVVDLVMTESAKYADIVLPGTSQIEHMDLNDSYSHLYLHWNEPAISPPGECLPHTEIFRRLAAALQLDEPALFASDEQLVRDALSGGDPSLRGITLEALREQGFMRLSVPEPYLPFAERFPTPSGRFEFASERAAAAGQGLLPDYVPPVAASDEPPPEDGAVSVVLLSTANHYLINSTFSDSAAHAKSGQPTVLISADDADRIGLVDEAEVAISTSKGRMIARGRRSTDVLPGVAATTKGLSPRLSGGVSVNVTTTDREADMARAATFHDNRVTISLATPAEQPAMAPAPAHAGAGNR